MKTIITTIKKNENVIFSNLGLLVILAACASIIILLAFHSNGNYSTDFVLGY